MTTVTKTLQGLFFATGLAFAMPAFAEDGPISFWASDDGMVQEAPAKASVESADPGVLSADELEELSGGTGVPNSLITGQTLTAINTGNTVTGVTVGSGEINIGANAFSGFDGVGNFVLNTGHNNNLQSSLNVSIFLGQ